MKTTDESSDKNLFKVEKTFSVSILSFALPRLLGITKNTKICTIPLF